MGNSGGDFIRYKINTEHAATLGSSDPSLRRIAKNRLEVVRERLMFVGAAGMIRLEQRRQEEYAELLEIALKAGVAKEDLPKYDSSKEAVARRCRLPESFLAVVDLLDLIGKTRRLDQWSELTHLGLVASAKDSDNPLNQPPRKEPARTTVQED